MARDKAREVLTDRARGRDPSAEKQARHRDITMADLCDRYLADAEAGRILGRKGLPKKASTLAIDRGRVAVHIIGIAQVDQSDVQQGGPDSLIELRGEMLVLHVARARSKSARNAISMAAGPGRQAGLAAPIR